MFGKAYDFHRLSGRMTMDHRQRMSNRAESGFGMVGIAALLIILGIILIGVM